jgi:hypothetical protein
MRSYGRETNDICGERAAVGFSGCGLGGDSGEDVPVGV